MPTITQSDNPNNSNTSPGLLWDEFLPIVEARKPSEEEFNNGGVFLIPSDKEGATLSKYLDNSEIKNLQEVETEKKMIKLYFTVKQGAKDIYFKDDDGYIEYSIMVKDKNDKFIESTDTSISITSKSKSTNEKGLFKKYGDEIELEINFNGTESTEFYIDFYANDNDDTFKGELENVFCGRVKVVKKEPCICQDDDWSFISPLVTENEKVLYGSNLSWTDNPECYHYALQQLRNLGYWVKTERWNKKWDGTKELNDDIFQIFVDEDVAGIKKGVQKEQFKKALIYLKQAMKTKTPVMVGLDYNSDYDNDDLTTDHFGVITGYGKDSNGLYFYVTDNAYPDQKYYCNCEDYSIMAKKGEGIDSYYEDTRAKITQIRISKKLN